MDLLGNVTVLERPTRVAALVSAVRAALRARQRQYQIRDHLAERERAEALREADRRKDEFLAMLAHELRNPLAPIRNSLHILRLTGRDDPAAERVGEMMERQVNHMVRLVDDLLDVSRITRGKIELRKEPVELAAVVRSAVETSRPLIEAAGHQLTVAIPPEPLTARRRSRPAGPGLRQPAEQRREVHRRRRADLAHGPARGRRGRRSRCATPASGIPPDMLPRVFELFTQVDGTREPRPGRARHRPDAGQEPGRDARRQRRGAQRGARARERVRRPPAAGGRAAAAPTRRRRTTGRPPSSPRAASWWSTTTATRPRAWRMLLKLLGAEVHVAYDGPDALEALATYQPGRRAARHRHAGHGRPRSGAADPPAARAPGRDAHRADRLGPGGGPPPLAGRPASTTT